VTFWADRATNESALRVNLLSLETTRSRHAGNDPDAARHDPDLWTDEFYSMIIEFLKWPQRVVLALGYFRTINTPMAGRLFIPT